jgi:hypothetical protein
MEAVICSLLGSPFPKTEARINGRLHSGIANSPMRTRQMELAEDAHKSTKQNTKGANTLCGSDLSFFIRFAPFALLFVALW